MLTVVHLDADGRRRHQSGPPRQAPRCDRRAERVPPLRHVREMDVPGRRCMKQLLFALKQKDSRYGGLTVTTLTSLNGSPTRRKPDAPRQRAKRASRGDNGRGQTTTGTAARYVRPHCHRTHGRRAQPRRRGRPYNTDGPRARGGAPLWWSLERPRQLLGALARRRRVISTPTLTTAPHAALSGVSMGSRHMQEDRAALFRGLTR